MFSFSRVPFAMLLLAACGEPTRGCDVCTYSATLYGNVSSKAGNPASGASVRVDVGMEPCAAGAPTFEGARTFADGTGRYRVQVLAPVSVPRCVRVEAAQATASSAGTEAPAVRFKPTADASLPYDSVRVDVRLP